MKKNPPKRLISCVASDIAKMSAADLKQSIIASEGRVVMCETVVTAPPLLDGVTNAEIAAAFSADLILLNEYDVLTKFIFDFKNNNLDNNPDKNLNKNPIKLIKKLTGKPIGINLEPADVNAQFLEEIIKLPEGRTASQKTFAEAANQNIDFICLTGNPATGVSNASIEKAAREAKQYFGGLVFAGKMHGASVNEKLLSEETALRFIEAGADGILIPIPGTAPGISEPETAAIVRKAKALGAVTIGVVGTSQESADPATIREIALTAKRAGFDIQHLGDGGYGRMPDPENLLALSLCIRGKRHTYFKMAASLNR